jgi:hypothetical protein
MRLTLVAGAILLVSPPARPPAGRQPTGCAAISGERMLWVKRPLASREQAEALPATRRGLPGRRARIFWSWAQGRYCSRRSSLGAKRQLRTEAFYCTATCDRRLSVGRRHFIPSATSKLPPAAPWHHYRRDRAAVVLARYERKTGILINCYRHAYYSVPLDCLTYRVSVRWDARLARIFNDRM